MSHETSTHAAADDAAKQRKKRYKKSLNLPRTAFPMRASLAQNEPLSRKRWDRRELYREILERPTQAPPFAFHDGPPFANGSIHVGHLVNKVFKDLVVRTRNLAGRRCHFVPGWDCHGLPIEHKVLTQLAEAGKLERLADLDEGVRRMAIRRECQRSAARFHKIQGEQMQRLLTLADYDQPYLTMAPDYEEAVLEVFAELIEQGLVYRALKPVHWSTANQTALAEAELEYRDRDDPSIYVGFDVVDPAALAKTFGLSEEALGLADGASPSLMIWTTTPWTLPANRLIAVEPSFRYALVRWGQRLTVVASKLVATVAEAAGGDPPEILGECDGAALLGLRYRLPLAEGEGWVVGADYVTLEDGTGLVHTAPGHGHEDFATGQAEGIEVYCPVLGDGSYDATVADWLRGLTVWEANPRIVDALRASGHLFHAHDFRHSYPHDWRSKTPVIFRCTEQWFIAVDRPTRRDARSLRQLALTAADDELSFYPEWGRRRFRGMLESRPDWCISRQRSWGLPIPAFRTPEGELLLTAASVRAVAKAFGRGGSDAWFTDDPAELLADYEPASDPAAPDGLDVGGLVKAYDIFDVWFESGSSWHAVMRKRGIGFPVDLYLEGSDQHRGWFQLSLLPALGATGGPPFTSIFTHGFGVDKEGKKMSKSLGNALDVDELLAHFGADVCRWWASSLAFETDWKVDMSYFELAGESYRKVRNTLRFLLGNLGDHDPTQAAAEPPPTSLDAKALALAAELRREVLGAYERYDFRRAHGLLFDFCNDTLSAFYLDAVKDRLYCDPPDSARRRGTQATMRRIAELLIHLLAPILPHTADEAWRALTGDDDACVHLGTFPDLDAQADAGWSRVMATRTAALKALEAAKAEGIENPLDAGLRLADADGTLAPYADELAEICGVSRVELTAAAPSAVTIVDLRGEPRCERSWRRDGTVRQRADGGWLSDRDAAAVAAAEG